MLLCISVGVLVYLLYPSQHGEVLDYIVCTDSDCFTVVLKV